MENEDSVYLCKDGRLRVYVKETKKTISYPKYLMEKELGRPLLPDEHVHHKDRNPLNNEVSNLIIMSHSDHAAEHARKYFDTTATCGWCGKEFMWTGKQQQCFYSNKRHHGHKSETPFCSRECSGHYGKSMQENGLFGGRSPMRKLTPDQVKYVRENYVPHDKKFGSRAIAREFGVDRSVIDCIIKGRTYKEVL